MRDSVPTARRDLPTNFFRAPPTAKRRQRAPEPAADDRLVRLTAGGVNLALVPARSQTADLIWRALPLSSVVETWGESIHFEVPVHAPRDRTARLNGSIGEVYFWSDDERIVICFGPTPISRDGEIRLMRPCNVWAKVEGDPRALRTLEPGTRVTLKRDTVSAGREVGSSK